MNCDIEHLELPVLNNHVICALGKLFVLAEKLVILCLILMAELLLSCCGIIPVV